MRKNDRFYYTTHNDMTIVETKVLEIQSRKYGESDMVKCVSRKQLRLYRGIEWEQFNKRMRSMRISITKIKLFENNSIFLSLSKCLELLLLKFQRINKSGSADSPFSQYSLSDVQSVITNSHRTLEELREKK